MGTNLLIIALNLIKLCSPVSLLSYLSASLNHRRSPIVLFLKINHFVQMGTVELLENATMCGRGVGVGKLRGTSNQKEKELEEFIGK